MFAKEAIKEKHRIELARHEERMRGPRKKSKRITTPLMQMEAWIAQVRHVMDDATKRVDARLDVMLSIFKQYARTAEYNRKIVDGEITWVDGCPCPIYIGPKAAKAERAKSAKARVVAVKNARVKKDGFPVGKGGKIKVEKARRLKLVCILDAQGREIDESGKLLKTAKGMRAKR